MNALKLSLFLPQFTVTAINGPHPTAKCNEIYKYTLYEVDKLAEEAAALVKKEKGTSLTVSAVTYYSKSLLSSCK